MDHGEADTMKRARMVMVINNKSPWKTSTYVCSDGLKMLVRAYNPSATRNESGSGSDGREDPPSRDSEYLRADGGRLFDTPQGAFM